MKLYVKITTLMIICFAKMFHDNYFKCEARSFCFNFFNAGLENDGNVMEGLNELNGGKLWTVLLADRKD